MSAPPPLPGSLTFGFAGSPTYEVFRLPKRSTSAPPMKPRSTCPCAISAIAFDIRVAHSASATFGGSPIVPRKAAAGWSRIRPTSKSPRALAACALRATAYARIGSRIPTNTRSPSRISREATATISSCGVYDSLIAEVRRRGELVVMNAQRLDVHAFEIGRAIRHVEDPRLQPGREALRGARLLRVLAIETVVSLEMSLHRRRVRAARLVDDRDHLGLRKQNPIWIAQGDIDVDELLAGHDHLVRREPGLLGDSERPPGVRAAHRVGPLHVDDPNVRSPPPA